MVPSVQMENKFVEASNSKYGMANLLSEFQTIRQILKIWVGTLIWT